jgi:hypothetical protein
MTFTQGVRADRRVRAAHNSSIFHWQVDNDVFAWLQAKPVLRAADTAQSTALCSLWTC